MLTTIVTAAIMSMVEFLIIVTVCPLAKPSIVLRFLPEDIREAAKDHPEPPKYRQVIAYGLLGIFLLVFIGGLVFLGLDGLKNGYGFWRLTLRFVVTLYIVKLFDIVVQDQWLVMTSGDFHAVSVTKIFADTFILKTFDKFGETLEWQK